MIQLAFTFAQNSLNNTMDTYDLAISINPTTPIINDVMEVGQVVAGTIAVANTGLVNAGVYLTADWGPSTGTTDRESTLLANALAVSVFISGATPTQSYIGNLIGLIDQPVIASLITGNSEVVAISVAIPDDRSGPTLLGKAVNTDFVFVAVSVA
ncbi:MAG TPA: hypothetical protein DDW50_16220 [Firmicutes bacterium]|nr:hypothetical protein [Bacillota bacterium]